MAIVVGRADNDLYSYRAAPCVDKIRSSGWSVADGQAGRHFKFCWRHEESVLVSWAKNESSGRWLAVPRDAGINPLTEARQGTETNRDGGLFFAYPVCVQRVCLLQSFRKASSDRFLQSRTPRRLTVLHVQFQMTVPFCAPLESVVKFADPNVALSRLGVSRNGRKLSFRPSNVGGCISG
jgi:hypothetical protein